MSQAKDPGASRRHAADILERGWHDGTEHWNLRPVFCATCAAIELLRSAEAGASRHHVYTFRDAGCYVDGACGIYAIDDIVAIARDHGASLPRDCGCDHDGSYFKSEFASCEWAHEYEDNASDFMNSTCPVDHHTWGRNENGDWGLWTDEDYDNGE